MDITSQFWCDKGHFNKDQSDFFIQLVKELNPKYVLETGFCTGRSAFSVLYQGCDIKKFITIDINFDYIKPEGRIMREKLTNHFTVFKSFEGSSQEILTDQFLIDEFPSGIDWFTVDGDHSYNGCMNELNTACKHINKNGIMIIDDYMSGPPNGCNMVQVTNACDNFHDKHPEFQKSVWNNKGKGLCILKKIIN